jgi:hypothetical protein
MFHVELRQFPHVARAFNLAREDLEARITRRWVQGEAVELDDRRWAPERAKLVIYEGRALAVEEIGLGRGWANVTRTGEQVTDRVLDEVRQAVESPPALAALKRELVARSARGAVAMNEVLELLGQLDPSVPEDERHAVANRAVIELLSEGVLELSGAWG